MGNPEEKAATSESLETRVNAAVGQLAENSEGIWEFPSEMELDDDTKFAAMAEKRRRDTQAELTKSKQKLKSYEATNGALTQELHENVKVTLSAEQQDELDDLMVTDPAAWRTKLNGYEAQALTDLQVRITETSSKGTKAAEIERRQQLMVAFNTQNPDITIDDQFIANELPPRITSKLESGEISFEEFLVQVKAFANPTIANNDTPNTPNLNKSGGGSSVNAGSIAEDITTSYKGEVY